MPRQAVTEIIERALKEFATFKDEDVREAIGNVVAALEKELQYIEYGESDAVNDTIAKLNGVMIEARETELEIEEVFTDKKLSKVAVQDEVEEEAEEDELEDEDDDELPEEEEKL